MKKLLLLLLLLASPSFAQWANIGTNLLGTKLDPSIRGSLLTDQYVVTFDYATFSYKLLPGGAGGGVTSLNAGTGISLSGPTTNPTVTNAGITGLNAGAGVSLSGPTTTPTVTNTGVLSVTAGSNVSITGTAANPIISATGGGGSGVVGFLAKSAGVSLNATPTTLDVDEGLTMSVSGVTGRITPTYETTIQGVANSASAGSANTFARGDHVHKGVFQARGFGGILINNLDSTFQSGTVSVSPTYGSPVSIGASTSNGTAETFARSNHTHAVTDLSIASQTTNDGLKFNGSNWVREAVGGNSTVLQVSSGGTRQWGTVTSAMITDGTITDTDVAAANKDGTAGTASMRTLGTGATQAAAGNAAPNAHAASHLPGGSDALTTATAVSVGATNATGSAASFARSDHTHAVTDLAIASQTTNDGLKFNGSNWVREAVGASSTVLQVSSGGVRQWSTITNAMIVAAAGIPYSKLTLTASLLVADVAASALTGTGTKLATDTGGTLNSTTIADYLIMADTGASAGAVGRFQRNGANLLYHDGTASRILEHTGRKNVANGYAGLDGSSLLTTSQVPALASRYKSGGSEAVKLDEWAATTDVTTLNSSTSAHGLLPKLDNTATHFLDGTGAWSTPTANAKFLINLMPGACEIVGNAADPLLTGAKSSTAGNASWSYLAYNDTTAQFGRWVVGPAAVKNYAGGNLTVHVWWYAAATTGGVVWTIKLLSRSAAQVMDAAYDTTTAHKITTAPAGTTLQLVDDSISIASGDSGEIIAGKLFLVQVERTTGDGSDTMTGDANLVAATVTED